MLASDITRLGGVLLILLCVGPAVSMREPLQEFHFCIQAKNIPPITFEPNSLLRTTLEIIQSRSGLEKVMECVSARVGQLKNSSDPVEWYVAHTFDPAAINQSLVQAASVYNQDKDYSCLRASLAEPQNECFLSVMSVLNETDPSRSDPTGMNVCSLNIDQCMDVSKLNHSCSSDEVSIIEATTALFYGKCYMNRVRVPTTSPGTIPDRVPDSALFRCGDKIFPNNDLAMLFPPSDVTKAQIINVTAAAEEQKKSLQIFCSHVQTYSACVAEGLTNPRSELDRVMAQLVNVGNLGEAFQYYCSIQDLVTSNFKCTKENLYGNCYGGVLDLVFRLNAELSATPPIEALCDGMSQAQLCRLRRQLKVCDFEYGSKMETFYNMLISDNCVQKGGPIFPKEYGEAVRCFIDSWVEIVRLFSNIQGSEQFKTALISSMRHTCSKRATWMPCLRKAHETSQNMYDKLIFKVMIPDNIDTITEFACDKVDAFEKHAVCVMGSFEQLIGTPGNCIVRMQERFNFSQGFDGDFSGMIQRQCETIEPWTSCMKKPFDECDAGLAKDFSTLGSMMAKGCNNPNAISSSGTSIIPVSALVVFITSVLFHQLFY